MKLIKASALAVSGLVFCMSSSSFAVSKIDKTNEKWESRVIYGNDDRLDIFQVTEPLWQTKAESTVALIQSSKIKSSANGFDITTSNYGKVQNLCKSEPFYDQVSAAFCSGSLIGSDLIITAGHCVRTQASCQTTRFVFNFAYKAPGLDPKSVSADDVYSCKQLIHSEVTSSNMNDFAIIRLDRPVVGRSPLLIRQAGEVTVGDKLTVIGHPSGLATKVAGGAAVRNNSNAKYFISNLDTYGGNSGSAVFNTDTGVVEGILVRGEQDFKSQGGCNVSNVCSDTGCRGEDVTRVTEILKYVDPAELVPVPVAPQPPEEDDSSNP